uniref:clp protease proteolytic subunit n=1 Tax=Mimosa diplotricha TaxID=512270 RepID=UPI0020291395|nr:clp protease proteolytic subunit [Mimosa diplotricha]UQU69229.1 clp protease proteolytic subunit [Mimosa diplotricha]UQV94472.1 clp protease proteolytic subunit [Mimosa diplotricha var. inermis]
MPIGVPKVPFRIPGEEEATWVDINRLYRERAIFLGQAIDCTISNQIIGLITFLTIESDTTDLHLFINCPGGWVLPGLGIFDMMQIVKPDVKTLCMSIAASMGSFLLVGGEFTKRIAFPHARVMIHQPASDFYRTQTGEFLMEAEEIASIREDITWTYVKRTGQPAWVIAADLERDLFMSAEEAKAHGIVDLIGM